jgi:dipeptidyl aminopeptidase/acylaminoacyl peptidase
MARMMRKLLLTLATVSALPAARFDFTTPEKIVRVADPQISPDGKFIYIVVSRASFTTDLWEPQLVRVDVSTKSQQVMADGLHGISSPRFSPDGTMLAFLANIEGKTQIHIMPVGGGAVKQITNSPTGVQHFRWRPDGKAFAFAALDEDPKKEGPERFNRSFEIQNNDYLRQSAPKSSHLWLAVIDGETRRVTTGAWTMPIAYPPGPAPSPISWTPDGKSVVIMKLASAYSGDFDKASMQMVDMTTGAMHPVTGRSHGESQPEISPDGSRIVYWYPRDGKRGNVNELFVSPIAGGEGRSMTRPLDRHILRGIWMPDGKNLLIAANDQTTTGVWIQPLDGPAKRVNLGKLIASASYGLDASLSRDGHAAMVASETQRPNELFYMDSLTSKPERLTDFNAPIAELELGRTETVDWDFEGFKEDGAVTYPPDYQSNRKYPLVLYIHGGPTGASKEAFSTRSQLLAAQGWIVFEPNYRGSDNLGNAYKFAIEGDAGAGPGRDVIAGMEALKKKASIDESRMAVSGWSYGGYMTSWMIGNYPDMWKAAVAGASVTDWVDMYNLGDSNVRRVGTLGGSPYTDEKIYRSALAQSPITYDLKARTPTLILALTGDYRVPIVQSYRLYHILRDNGVPTKFIAYPLTGHNPADPVHQQDVDRRWVEWLKAYLDPKTKAD